jgi:hypothetical protein
MKNVEDEEQIKDPTMNTILIFDLYMSNKFVSNNFRKTTLDIGTCSYHGWPWDIGSIGKPHWHLFHHIFWYLVRISRYQPPFNVMQTVISFNDPSVWIQACEQRVVLFRRVMFMAMENLTIVQH